MKLRIPGVIMLFTLWALLGQDIIESAVGWVLNLYVQTGGTGILP